MHTKNLLFVALMTGSLVLADAAAAHVLSLTTADVHGCVLREGQPAVGELRTIADLTPADAEAHYNLGLALNNVGRHADAMRAYREAVRLQPDYADAWGNLGLATERRR